MNGRPGRTVARAAGIVGPVALLLLSLAGAGCRVNLPALATEPSIRPGLTLPPPPPGGYALDKPFPLLPGDTIDITVRDDSNLNTSLVIPSDGVIEIFKSEGPDGRMQTIPTTGMTVEELKEKIAEIYGPKFITKPYVQVVAKYVDRVVYVRGAVKSTEGFVKLLPGRRLTLYRAIQAAGLDAENADLTQVTISRTDPVTGTDVSLPAFDLYEMEQQKAFDRDPPLEPNDIVLVPVLGRVSVWGHVNQSGSYRCTPGMTVLDLLGEAQGVKEFAKLSDVRVVRSEGTGRERTFRVDVEAILDGGAVDPRLVPGDRVWVAETWK